MGVHKPHLLLVLLYCSFLFYSAIARPAVRNLHTHHEFQRLLNYHKDVTGLPVVVDFYSDGCGPCRMVAPHFKRLAKQFKNRVVFAKVDINANRETAGFARIRSMPTFHFYVNGKRVHQFSGADVNQIQTYADRYAREAEANNVRVTRDALLEFYKEHAPEKATEENIDKVMAKAGGEKGGAGHRKLHKALVKKYGKGPETEKRYVPGETGKGKEKGRGRERERAGSGRGRNGGVDRDAGQKGQAKVEANLHLASMEELEAELERRREKEEVEREQKMDEEESEDDDTETADAAFQVWTPDDQNITERVVIIGGGPAGLSAAIYAARSGLSPVIVAPPAGGQLQGKGVTVENYPAVQDATGPQVVYEMMKQAARYGTLFYDEMATAVDLVTKEITTNSSNIRAHTIIIATGADSRWLGIEGEDEHRGGGVSSCATCDGYLYKDLPVVVIGGGDTAMEEALHLARTSSKVTIIHRRDKFSASYALASRVLQHDKIEIIWNTSVVRFEGEKVKNDDEAVDASLEEQSTLTHAILVTKGTEGEVKFACDGAFIAIGHDPNTWLFKEQLEMADNGYIITKGYSTLTSVPGVFAAGDVADPIYRQAITSAGTGAMAALDAERYLSEQGIEDERQKAEDDFMQELMNEIKGSEEKEL